MENKTTFPISIATAIAIQAICGFDPEGIPLKTGPSVRHYRAIYLNLRTLMRNFLGSQDPDFRKMLNVNDIIYGVSADIRIIHEIMQRYAPTGIKIVPYINTLSDIKSVFPKAVFREVRTELQKHYLTLETGFVKAILDMHKSSNVKDILISNTQFSFSNKEEETLILTHQPIDLLNERMFRKLVLLESHTGKLKHQTEWNTKLKNFKPEYHRIPFNSLTIQLFGDTGDMFSPSANPKIKNKLAELSEKFQWNPLTTTDRMINCARLSNDKELTDKLLEHRVSNW